MGPLLRRFCSFVVLVVALGALPAAAQDFPTHPIRIVVGFPPGGGVDLVARLIGQEMAKGFGQLIVESKPGAAGTSGPRSSPGAIRTATRCWSRPAGTRCSAPCSSRSPSTRSRASAGSPT
jgi:hypothetical protein